jgi:NADH-quinone oxidoreductase subunit C/D
MERTHSITLNMGERIEKTDYVFDTHDYVVNFGPQHPAMHGVLHLRVALDGEIILKIDHVFGYIHRGIEKMCESYTYPQILHLADRLDYLSGTMNRHAVCLCCENALGLEVPERAHYIRTIFDELTRIASHLLGWGCMCMDMGSITAFVYGMRDREKIMDIFEETAGGRLMANYNVIGGVMKDIHPNFQRRVKELIPYIRKMLKEHHLLFTGNPIARGRMEGIGRLTKKKAISLGATGPSGRASGWHNDIRKIEPYAAYAKTDFEEVLRQDGMTFDRYVIRLDEIEQSLRIIEQLIDNIPEGPFAAKTKAVIRLPEGEFFQRVENARGQFCVHITSKGDKSPYRVKFRSPSLVLVGALKAIATHSKVADLIMLGASLDYVIPCIDR